MKPRTYDRFLTNCACEGRITSDDVAVYHAKDVCSIRTESEGRIEAMARERTFSFSRKEWTAKYGRFVYRTVVYLIQADTKEEAEKRYALLTQERDAKIADEMEREPERARVHAVGNMR